MTHLRLSLAALSFVIAPFTGHALAAQSITYASAKGPGAGKRVVLLSGDEAYRSEEVLVQLGRILARRHGFESTVLFSLNAEDGTIDPNAVTSLGDPDALARADVIVMMLRFRQWPDDVMQRFVAAYLAGKPIVALRTATHPFKYDDKSTSPFRKYSYQDRDWIGGFGRQVLGETWVAHVGNRGEATLALVEPPAKSHPLLRGIDRIFAPTGVYKASPPSDATILLRGQVLAGMTPDSPPDAKGKNDPMQPVAWTRLHQNAAGKTNRVFCTTMGSAQDLSDEQFRRLLINAVYWGLEMDIPARADASLVGSYDPSPSGMNGFRKGVKPADLALP